MKVISTDDKITPGQAALLDKLKIRPFEYKMHIINILDNGETYPAKVLAIKPESVLSAFNSAAQNVTAVSLAIGMPNQQSVHHLVLNAFKNLACASFGSGFSFKEADKLANSAANAPAASGPAGGDDKAAKAAAEAAAKKKAEEEAKKKQEEEEEAMDMGDLFGY